MPVYHFQTSSPGRSNSRHEPLQLANDDAAWEEAIITCGEMIKDLGGNLAKGSGFSLQVANAENLLVFTIELSTKIHAGSSLQMSSGKLREMASECRKLAADVSESDYRARLLANADEYDKRADEAPEAKSDLRPT